VVAATTVSPGLAAVAALSLPAPSVATAPFRSISLTPIPMFSMRSGFGVEASGSARALTAARARPSQSRSRPPHCGVCMKRVESAKSSVL
jgi:hypothetical protein